MSRLRKRLAAERGSILVEVLVGTILLALTTAAVLDGLDGAQETGRKNKDRSTSATLAQQDIERMRSLPPSILAGMNQTRTVTVASVPYTVVSRAEWVSDANGVVSCESANAQAEYLRLTATVNSPAGADAPVSASSLLTPSNAFGDDTGTAAIKLTDRDGEPLDGVTVSLSGPGSESATTNDLGCAIFAYIDTGNWTASVSGGLVNWNGGSPSTTAITVAVGKTSTSQMELDVPASLRASFVTPTGASTTYRALSVSNSKLGGGVKTATWTTPTATRDVDKLFPFYDGYGVYAGSCKANNPALWDSDYFANPSGLGFAALDPGEALQPVQVVVPQIVITVRRLSGNPLTPQAFSQAQFYVRQRDTAQGCTATLDSGTVTPANSTAHAFVVPVPFGNYEVCAATRTSSGGNGSWRKRVTSATTAPVHRNMTTTEQAIANSSVDMDTTTTTGSCL